MKFTERLKSLIGHEVFVNACIDRTEEAVEFVKFAVDENLAMDIGGILEEVGDDYILVRGIDKGKCDSTLIDAEWLFSMDGVSSIVHLRDCKKCAIDSALSSTTDKNNA